jgi:glycosyltransferase involved in cell wall biosynthesis
VNHVGLAVVNPTNGFAHWRILPEWVDRIRAERREQWNDCRPILRLYDVSFIEFNGLNAHRVQDHTLPELSGHMFFHLPGAGTCQLAEVGFLLRCGEFIPAARSQATAFPRDTASPRCDHSALLVESSGVTEEVGNVWDQEKVLAERNTPRLRSPLRIATFALESTASGQQTGLAAYVSNLAAAQRALGHEVHVFVPGCDGLPAEHAGVYYHGLRVPPAAGRQENNEATCLEVACDFGREAAKALESMPPFDVIHLHEWITGHGAWFRDRPTVLSLTSIEAKRRDDNPATETSLQIEALERELAGAAGLVLVPHQIWTPAVEALQCDRERVHGFSTEGRAQDEWETPLDTGQVKSSVSIGPLDRMLMYVGPLEHSAGVDLLVEALPVVLHRVPNLRFAFVGAGPLAESLHSRAQQLGVAYAVRLLGHIELPGLARLLRSAEGLVLPSRYRVPFDDAVVDLARRAGKPVVTTHGGPAHLVRHEETGLITYDNPGSMVWAMDRLLGDPAHGERMGRAGRKQLGGAPSWEEAARYYFELCARCIPELTVRRGTSPRPGTNGNGQKV